MPDNIDELRRALQEQRRQIQEQNADYPVGWRSLATPAFIEPQSPVDPIEYTPPDQDGATIYTSTGISSGTAITLKKAVEKSPSKPTTVINLIGGPGVGKSTMAALLFALMKQKHKSCELVREGIKEAAWQDRKVDMLDQVTIFGEQARREKMYYGKVDYLITDSPLLLCPFYQKKYCGSQYLSPVVRKWYEEAQYYYNVTHLNYILERPKNVKYQQEGRYENEEEAIDIDAGLKDYVMRNYNVQDVEVSNAEQIIKDLRIK